MDHGAGLPGLVAGPIGFVLEGHPAVAGLRERTHHSSIQIPRAQRLARQTPRFGLGIGMLEILSVHIRQFRNVLRIEQRPILVGLDSPHEQVGHPIGEIEMMCAPRIISGVLAQLEKSLDVSVPCLQINARRAFAFSSLVDRRHRGIQRLEPRHDAIGQAIG